MLVYQTGQADVQRTRRPLPSRQDYSPSVGNMFTLLFVDIRKYHR